MNSIASNSPIVREMVFRIICAGEIESIRDKHRIDSEIIPTLSKKTQNMSHGLSESSFKITTPLKIENPIQEGFTSQKSKLFPPQTQHVILEGYGRLTGLIRDGSISSIEYLGESLPIKIIRLGKMQNTNIILSNEEVKSLLDYISSRTRIPITNKVFRVALDNILFNAIVSEEIGTRFLIKKNFQISQDYHEAFK